MKLKIEGLFGRQNYELDFSKNINILIGENGDGKSTILKIVNSIFSYDFVKLATVKFQKITLSYKDKSAVINKNDLFALNDYYFPQVSYSYDEKLLNKALIRNERNIFKFSFAKNTDKSNIDKLEISDNKYLKFKNFPYFSKLIADILKIYGVEELNDYISILMRGYKDNKSSNIIEQLVQKDNVFSFILKNFKKEKSVFRLEDFNGFLLEINSFIKVPNQNSFLSIIARSNFFLTGKYLKFISLIKEISRETEYNSELKNSNFFFNFGAINRKVTNLNMVELIESNWKLKEIRTDEFMVKTSNLVQSLVAPKSKEYEEFLVESEVEPSIDIRNLYDRKVIEKSLIELSKILKFSSTSESLDLERKVINDKIRKIKYYIDDSLSRTIRAFEYQNIRKNNKNNRSDLDAQMSSERIISNFIRFLERYDENYDDSKIKYEFNQIEKSYLNKLDDVYELLKELWENKSSIVKSFEKIVSSYFSGKKVNIEPSKKALVTDSNGKVIPIEFLSSGEKKIITIFKTIVFGNVSGIYLIDEPELSLSIDWQKRLLRDLNSILSSQKIIIATQSNHIVTDEFGKYIVPLLSKD